MLSRHERTRERLEHDLGPIVLKALKDPEVNEILYNADETIWLDTYSGMRPAGQMPALNAKNLINLAAVLQGEVVTEDKPNVAGEIRLDIDGEMRLFRFQGVVPPLAEAPIFAIRKPPRRVIPLSECRKQGVISEAQEESLTDAVRKRLSIVVSGGTSSGKTTLCNALLNEISLQCPDERIAIIEDTLELQCAARNKIQLKTSDTRDMDDLLRYCMRLRPDRIVVGEVRGKEANSLIKAWNTGHPGGLSTVHANSARESLSRLERLIAEANVPPSPQGIAEAIGVLVYMERTKTNLVGRQVTEVVRLLGYDKKAGYLFE